MAVITDPNVYPFMTAGVECIREELECQGRGVCRYDVLVTDQDQLDGCDCECGTRHDAPGRVWARLENIDTDSFFDNCSNVMVAKAIFGISRCAATGEKLPKSDVLRDQAIIGYADMHAMRVALLRCVPSKREKKRSAWRYRLNQWNPIGPDGGCYGGAWTVDLMI